MNANHILSARLCARIAHPRLGFIVAIMVFLPAIMTMVAVEPAKAQSPEQFYKGKSVSVVIGYSAGGGYDTYARLLARHLGRHIPGNPNVVPQNMTGAGSLKAASYLFNAAPKDGTVIGTFSRGMAITPLLTGGDQFDGTKFFWLGSMTVDVSLCITSTKSKITTLQDFIDLPSNVGGEGPGADPDIFASMYKNVFNSKLKLVTGYHGTADMMLAMERNEIDGFCGISWSSMKATFSQYLSEKKVNIIVQTAPKKDPDLSDTPLTDDLAKTPEQKQILQLLSATQEMARPFAAPPGTPADRAQALRSAFVETMTDPAFLADARKLNADINPVAADRLDALVKELYQTPPDVVAKAVKATQ